MSAKVTGSKRGTPRSRVKIVQITVMNEDGTSAEVDAKECTKCCEVKALMEYHVHKRCLGGVNTTCTVCRNKTGKRRNTWYVFNGVEMKECNLCLRMLPPDCFHRNGHKNRNTPLYKPVCRDCGCLTDVRRGIVNKLKTTARWHRRYARKRATPSDWTVEHLTLVLTLFGEACALTHSHEDVHLDHVIPLAWGHGGSYVGNMITLSGALNISKHDTHLYEWFETNRQRFELDHARFDAMTAIIADQNGLTSEEYREYYDWCYANQRNINEIRADNERYGYVVSSIELWREATGIAFPMRLDLRSGDEYRREADVG